MKIKLTETSNITTGKLDSNASIEDGKYPFYTCAPSPLRTNTYSFDDDVILLAGNNSQGNFHINRFKGKFDAYQRTYVITAKKGWDIDYIGYSLEISLQNFKRMAQGSQTKFLTMDILSRFDINKVPLKEQKLLIKTLKDIDKKISLNNEIINELNKYLSLNYDYWFTQFDFPNESGQPYKSSGGKMVWNEKLKREIPEGWKVQTLFKNEISEIVSGGVEPYDGTKEYLATADIDENGALEGELLNYDERPNRANMSPIKNSVWVAKMADSPKRLFFTDESNLLDQYIISTGMFAFTSNKEHYEYLMMYLFSDHFEKLKDRFAQGATQRAINQANLSLFPIVIPEENILKQFHNLTKDMVRKIELLKEENIELKKQRDFLLPLLMNGQVTIK